MVSSKQKIIQEVLGVSLIALGSLVVISLYTYSPSDPSYNSYVSEVSAVKNSAGVIGAKISDILIQSLGAGAWLAPVLLLYVGGLFCYRPTALGLIWFLTGYFILMVSISTWTHIHWSEDPVFSGVVSGGAVGQIASDKVMIRWFSIYGSYVILTALILCSLLLMTRMSVSGAAWKLFSLSVTIKRGAVVLGYWILRQAWRLRHVRIPLFMETEESYRVREKKKRIRLSDMEIDATDEEDDIFIPQEPRIVNLDPEEVPTLPKGRGGDKNSENSDSEFQQEILHFSGEEGEYQYPTMKLLDAIPEISTKQSKEELIKRSMILEKKLLDFGIEGRVTQVLPGPVITVYEFEPAPGIKVARIVGLADDLAMVLRATSIRILAPIPGKSVVGIEVPNVKRETVYLKEMLSSQEFTDSKSKMTLALGKDISGAPVMADLAQVPHLLIAGSTGSGKSVGINAMICSILYNATPSEVKFIMIDPKMLELSIYQGIPHLIAPVVTNPKKAANALGWAVEEMERRYLKLSEFGVRNIDGYNRIIQRQLDEMANGGKSGKLKSVEEIERENKEPAPEKLPYIVVVIDELADLMMIASKAVEDALARLAQMARAAGIHLIVATQRPSVDVLTGLIKANFPARISYQVRSRTDSRTILDSMGAEKLLGKGDMLYLPPGTTRMMRINGPFVSDVEIHRVVDFLKNQQKPVYDEEILKPHAEESADGFDEEADEFYDKALELVARTRQASISMIQRRFRIGYNRAARIVEMMERQGLVGPADGIKPREVYVRELDDVETVN